MIGRESTPRAALIDAITSVDNLTRAWGNGQSNIRVAHRGRSRGVDNVTILDFEADWATHMERLALDLRSGQYRPIVCGRAACAGAGRTLSPARIVLGGACRCRRLFWHD